jgi:ATP phosphoribosyltransferase
VAVKIALPKGRLLTKTADLLQTAGWQIDGYDSKTRSYHLASARFPELAIKIFQEKDIPIQVSIGNYDLGICGLDWVEELKAKYPSSALLKVRSLGYGEGALYIAASRFAGPATLDQVKTKAGAVRIATEYPNLAEAFALRNRLGRFSIFPVWGGAEAYPPENADLALVAGKEGTAPADDLTPITKVLSYSAVLVANRRSWESKDLGHLVTSICDSCAESVVRSDFPVAEAVAQKAAQIPAVGEEVVRLALPDGHQQTPTLEMLSRAGIQIDDYPSPKGNRRPTIHLDGVMVKVIRPQDMPLQVANGNFDLAITGRDWLREHLYQFPSSPVQELIDLKFGWVRIVAVVSQALSVDSTSDLRQFIAEKRTPLRVASEYVNIADKYARDRHLGYYRVIPTWGATEAFLPEDADLLIENTQTGQTIARHNLKIIDTLFESTACLISQTGVDMSSRKGRKMKSIIETLRRAVRA